MGALSARKEAILPDLGGGKPLIGILTLQGAVQDHFEALEKSGGVPLLVRSREDLEKIDGLIIPGGESTVMSRFLEQYHLVEPIREHARSGRPLWGICAGSILLARQVLISRPGLLSRAGTIAPGDSGYLSRKTEPGTLALLPFIAERNSYGRQLASREHRVFAPSFLPEQGAMMPFIRAPRFILSQHIPSHYILSKRAVPGQTEAGFDELQVLAETGEGEAVGVIGGPERNILACSFHPELTGETGFHQWLVKKAQRNLKKGNLKRESASLLPA